ncbi:hypothetical protein BCR36DRAFT_369731 [Piromyces finnis]|uniref:Uncharacterized protein n=1 Tax=Piromyces finnis TaxID=1754191 RepID=A0A1Y1VBF7_9FUNG|nr:hypothetical protein BCR36DRAFT_369731 [Piromyces finnis]|eukprot:ORX51823.1 hypothetical protein BCR36DRAFT_369731 [Piromyces finnis]
MNEKGELNEELQDWHIQNKEKCEILVRSMYIKSIGQEEDYQKYKEEYYKSNKDVNIDEISKEYNSLKKYIKNKNFKSGYNKFKEDNVEDIKTIIEDSFKYSLIREVFKDECIKYSELKNSREDSDFIKDKYDK